MHVSKQASIHFTDHSAKNTCLQTEWLSRTFEQDLVLFARGFLSSLNGSSFGIRPVDLIIEYRHREWTGSLHQLQDLQNNGRSRGEIMFLKDAGI